VTLPEGDEREANMNMYLVQHAEAKSDQEDPLRPLSAKGHEDITRISIYLSQLNIPVTKIFHSTKLRAKQTAEILFEHLRPGRGVSEADGLSPLDEPAIWAERIRDLPDGVILVGHLPHLARLASLLLCGATDNNIVSFRMAGIVCLKRDDAGSWSMQWMLTPDVVIGERGTGYACDGL
jgi:phosphohistidine phosphatase